MALSVAVVGGSVAGLRAAAELARRGIGVAVFDANGHRPPLRRSLIVTHAFRDLLGPVGESSIVGEIHRFELFAGEHSATISLGRPDLIIERAALVRSLETAAIDAGARVHHGHKLVDVATGSGPARLRFRNGREVTARVLIGADGWRSVVARCTGLRSPRVVPLVQAIVDLPEGMSRQATRVWFEPRDTPYFYWLIPDSGTTGALGIIGADGSDPRRRLDTFAARQGLRVHSYQAARIPEYDGWSPLHRRCGGADVYLVGDAAGHVKVTTVGGVVDGIWGADGVAGVVAGDTSAAGRTALARLRRELGLHLLIRRALHRFSASDYRQLLAMLDHTAKAQLGRYGRDQTARLMLHLILRRPRFLLLGGRALLDNFMVRFRRPAGDRVAVR